jgi:choline dehydrogenase-like flavoprotein
LLIDGRTLSEDEIIETDICIIGAGPAGISLAHEFLGQPFRVCLLESGGLEPDEQTESLSDGENIGLPYLALKTTRFRYFGGTLGMGAWCLPLDEIDFEKRDWVPYSGWPFDKSHLDPFYERARRILRLGSFADDVGVGAAEHSPRLPFTAERVITKIIQIGPPIPFGKAYRDEIERAENIRTYLYTNVVDIETTDTAETVTRLRVACLQGNKFWVSARLFVLATGGIENARLLLLSNNTQSTGLGNQNSLVGRFFMEHPHVESGVFNPSDAHVSEALYRLYNIDNVGSIRALTLADQTLRHERLLNFSATFELPHSQLSTGATSIRLLLEAIRRRKIPAHLFKHLSNVVFSVGNIAVTTYNGLFSGTPDQIKFFRFYNRIEQSPNPDSRVTLSAERDIFGKKQARLDWRLSAIDRRSMKRANEIMHAELNRAGLGNLKIALDNEDASWPPSLTGGHHHMGTTRMHVDPKGGVVNEDCRLHAISNLFVAGSSVFPTSGCANPTLTIVALAVRLADHVKRLMKQRSV